MQIPATFLTVRIPDFEAAIRKAVDARLASRPVVVITAFKQLGRVVAACPLARAHGVREEMHFPTARLCCPDAAFHLPDKRLAEQAMRTLLRGAGKYSPLVEPAGGGRMVLDTKGTERLWGDNRRVAALLRRDVETGLRLPAAAGLASCRPWSLLASRAAGDDGICHVPPGEESPFLDRAPVDWVDGLTPRARTLLLEMNIRTLGQIRRFERAELARLFGRDCGDALWNVLHPHAWDKISLLAEDTLLEMEADRIRVEAALAEATVAAERLRIVVRTLAARVAASLRAKKLGAARLRLTLLHADGALKTAEARTGGFIQAESALQDIAERLLGKVFVRRVQAIRLWLEGDRLSGPERQGCLFPAAGAESDAALPSGEARPGAVHLLETVDRIRIRYGDMAVKPAALLGMEKKARPRRRRPGPRPPAALPGSVA